MGSANDKIIYLNSTKELIKNKINDLGGELDSQDPFREYSNSLDIIYEEYPKINDTNENITLQNTNAGKMEIELKSTELTQDGTPDPESPIDVNVITGSNNVKLESKNLFNKNNINDFYSYQTNVTINDDKSITITGDSNSGAHYAVLRPFHQFKTGKTYTISFDYEGNLGQMIMFKTLWETQGNRTTTKRLTFSITENDTTLLGLGFYVDTNRTLKVYNIQIEEGSTATEYVEHQEQNYPITLSSKNLFNIKGNVNTRYNGQTGNYNTVIDNDLTSTYSNNNGYIYGQRIYVGVGKTVTVSAKVKSFVPNNKVGTVGRITAFNDNTTYGASYVTYNNDETEIKTLTFTPTTDYIYVAFGFVAPTSQQSSVTFTDIQVEYGETATTYMPYIANPIEYCKIGDYADELIRTSGKNLFNIEGNINTRYNGSTENYNSTVSNKLITTYSTNNGYPYGQRIYVGAGKKVTISGIVTNINSTGSKSALIMCFNDNTTTGAKSIAFDDTEINTRKSFSFTPNTDYIIIAFAGRYNGFVSATFTDIQVEYGDNTTDYEPYGENEWYLKKNIKKRIFDGSETNWLKDGNSYKINQSDMLTANVGKGLCNYFKNSRIDYSYTAGHIRFGWSNTYIYFYVDTENIADVNAWKDWLSTHNTKVYYQLATPTYIHISETDYPILKTQLENLYNNAQSYNGETNIIQINDDLSFIIKAIALMGGDE